MKHYYFAFYGNDLLLERQDDGTYSIPYREEPPTATDGKTAMLDVAYADGTTAKTYDWTRRRPATEGLNCADLEKATTN